MKAGIAATIRLILCATLLLAALPGGTTPSAAEELQPPCPGGPPDGSPSPTDGALRRAPNGSWYMPADSIAIAEPSAVTLPQGVGGPDDFGYTWSDEVELDWIDVTGGINTGMSGDSSNQATGPVALPFSFRFYENAYNEVYIAAAGYLAFTKASYWDSQARIPAVQDPNNVIAPFWTPTYIGAGSWVRYAFGGTAPDRYLVVEWHDVRGGAPGDPIGADDVYRFQAILYESGDISFQYQTMDFNGNWYCGDIGIEDAEGQDGLSYIDYCQQAPSDTAVHVFRPLQSARVSLRPLYQGRFTHAEETVAFEVRLRNTGELGPDTYDLDVSTGWPVELYSADGTTPLTDTDGDGKVDVGSVEQGDSESIVVTVTTPETVVLGDDNTASITFRSSLNTEKTKTVFLDTAVPAPFAQVYRDNSDGAMSLHLVQPAAEVVKKVTADRYYGYEPTVAETPSGFVYLWTGYRWNGSVGTLEIEYTLLDRFGDTVRSVSRLTDHSRTTVRTYDYSPALTVATNGNIGIAWYRYLYNSTDSTWNYNIYYAILGASGNVIVPPTNLTNNPVWGCG